MSYLKHTLHFGSYLECCTPVLECYSNSNWASDRITSNQAVIGYSI